MFHDNNYIFQQDGAPSHTNHAIQQFFNENAPGFMEKDEWPPLSPDLYPMNYGIWDLLLEKVYRGITQKFTEEELKWRLLEWITLEKIKKCINVFKKRLRLVFKSNGGPIDHIV